MLGETDVWRQLLVDKRNTSRQLLISKRKAALEAIKFSLTALKQRASYSRPERPAQQDIINQVNANADYWRQEGESSRDCSSGSADN